MRMSSWSVIVMVLATALVAGGVECGPTADRLYVATNGSDSWSGKLAAPNKAKTDGPLATLEGARDSIRRMKTGQQGLKRPITVSVRKGTYFLAKTFELASQDTGTRECPITYEAYATPKGAERVVISGGKVISGFAPVEVNGLKMIAADVPGAREGKWNPDQLFVNDRRADRTRLPKQGWYTIKSAPIGDKWQEGQDSFTFNDGEIKADWRNLTDVDVISFTLWIEARMPIKSVDEAKHTVQLAKRSTFWLADGFNPKVGARYCLENVIEALDAPGQWYLDRSAGTVYYYPRPGENWSKAEFIAPVLESLVHLNGTDQQPVEYVRFRNLRFAHTQHTLPASRAGSVQAAVDVPAAVILDRVRKCDIGHCEISHIGTYAIDFSTNCSNCNVHACKITDLGAGGVRIGQSEDSITVADNEISDGGKIFASAVGVWIAGSPHNRIVHNLIHDFNYTGVSVGWSWGYGKSNAFDNLVASNHIHHIGRGVLADLGGIYTLGVSPGTILRNNLIHDSECRGYGGWGIYTDEGSSGILIENNVVYRAKSGGFHQHYGQNNIVTNNIFAFAKDFQLRRTRAEDGHSFTFERNIVYYDTGGLLDVAWDDDHYTMDYNDYFDTSGRPITFAGASLEDWKKRGHDQHSIIADPGFVDPKKADFRLKPDSPAFKLGFKQIDVSKVGPREAVGVEPQPSR
jgi:parallel beta-helix repeat protein